MLLAQPHLRKLNWPAAAVQLSILSVSLAAVFLSTTMAQAADQGNALSPLSSQQQMPPQLQEWPRGGRGGRASLRAQLRGRKIIPNISYVPGSTDKLQVMDLILPPDAQPNGPPIPLVVWVHGGGWWGGQRENGPYARLLAAGFAVATIDYRLSPQARFPAQIYDCKAAIRWLRAHGAEYNLNTKKIGVWGSSAGGHLVSLLGTTNGIKSMEGDEGNLNQSSSVQAVCDWFGPSDLTKLADELRKMGGQSMVANMIASLLGGPAEQLPDKAKQASPVTWVSPSCPPFFIVHGDADHTVPINQSEELLAALKAKHVPATMFVVKGGRHGFPNNDEAPEMVLQFFQKYIQGKTTTP